MSKYIYKLLVLYRWYFSAVLVLACLSAVLNTSFGAMLKWLTDGLQHGRQDVIFYFIALFSLQRFLLPIAGAGGTLVSNKLANRIESDVRDRWYEHVVRMDYRNARHKNSGEYQKKIQEAVASVRALLNNTLRSLLSIALEIVSVTLFSVWLVGWRAGAILISFAVVYSAFVIYVTKRRVPLMRDIVKLDAECSAFMHDSFINSDSISPAVMAERINRHHALLAKLEIRKDGNSNRLFVDSLVSSFICLVVCFASLMLYYRQGGDSIGVVVMLATGLAQLISQINALGFNYRNVLGAKIDILRISEGLRIEGDLNCDAGCPVLDGGRYKFSFRDFRIADSSNRNMPPINGDITIELGSLNILRGPSGIGKSTVARAMRGEIRSSAEQLLINDADVIGLDSDLLLKKMGYVSQDNIIFNESIVENLRYGKRGATLEEIIDTLTKVGLHKFTGDLEYVVGEKGGRLSGGERQRLVIARGLLQECDILILDEPFSGLDEKRASDLAGTIVRLADSTVIFVIMHQRPEAVFNSSSTINSHVMEEFGGEIHIKRGR
ncbi:ABC-type multidrug transport system fused ATPase/permease subunit [Burkholderia ambifaria]|nr:ABC transporter ATP-binding protein [Burkholderia ambifaria]MDR6500116.1 ABC-type multidrug transport system fused ATPase/permease subunit [Burkholderia ambifaria]